ncbi:GrpB family protein [Streptomyces sp. CA-132043]|uniref:GrpB family protein n=1 Tax=Streptomyces sp. CA-132043 TaxID=3240048 RepID=UPI003D8D9345
MVTRPRFDHHAGPAREAGWLVIAAAREPGGHRAVPGLAAKPVIDLMAAADDLAVMTAREAGYGALAELGYRRHRNGMADRLLYVGAADGRRTRILPPASTSAVFQGRAAFRTSGARRARR